MKVARMVIPGSAALLAWIARPPPPPPALSVAGWTGDGQTRVYTADNLYEYMDGNSEGYFLYHFQEMRGVTCKQGDVTFVIDISDMSDPDYAFGMFTSTRDLRQPAYPVGTGGQIVPRRRIFAKGDGLCRSSPLTWRGTIPRHSNSGPPRSIGQCPDRSSRPPPCSGSRPKASNPCGWSRKVFWV